VTNVFAYLVNATEIIGWVLVHFIWQCGALGLFYWVARIWMPRGNARYRLGMVVLIALALWPLATLEHLVRTVPSATVVLPVAASLAAQNIAPESSRTLSAASDLDTLVPWFVLAWFVGVSVLSLRTWQQWRALKVVMDAADFLPLWQSRVAKMSTRFGLRRNVRVLSSQAVDAPMLLGWLRPIILLPVAVACNFPAAQVELIFAHELAHLKRWDPLANFFQVMLETIFFYHPILHWISRDVRNEREICCDKLALSVSGGNRYEFAAALAGLGDLRVSRSRLSLAANGGILLERVRQLVVPGEVGMHAKRSAGLAVTALAVISAALAMGMARNQQAIQSGLLEYVVQFNPVFESRPLAAKPVRFSDLIPQHATVLRPLVETLLNVKVAGSAKLSVPLIEPMGPLSFSSPHVSDLAIERGETPIALPTEVPQAASQPIPEYIRPPTYPYEAVTRGVEGKVTLEFAIADDGSVRNIRVVQATPGGVFDLAAEQAMRLWRYSPNMSVSLHKNRYRQAFTFSLKTPVAAQGAGAVFTSGEVSARLGCQVTTGSHICRWPESNSSNKIKDTVAHTIDY
jgi:bla regulator protein BlaR1